MLRRRRWWLCGLVAVVLVGIGAVTGTRAVRRARYGDVHTGRPAAVVVHHGERFSVAVPDRGASVGDHWSAAVAPAGVVTLARSELVAGNVLDRLTGPVNGGGAGTRYFVFDARHAGSATVRLRNCFQGCDSGRTRAQSRDAMWVVTVR